MYDRDGNIIDRREMLRVKIKSLAEEAKIIRKEVNRLSGRKRHRARVQYQQALAQIAEQNLSKEDREALIRAARTDLRMALAKYRPYVWSDLALSHELRWHASRDVRGAARSAHIAYGLIRGRSLERIETAPKSDPDWKEIERLVKKFGPPKGMELPDRAKAKLSAQT